MIKEGLPFSKEAVDAAHAKYVVELQEADEAKVKAAEEAREVVEATGTLPETGITPRTPKTSLKPDAQRLLELIPHMSELIVEMWDASRTLHG